MIKRQRASCMIRSIETGKTTARWCVGRQNST